jgi:hypothetical protein
LTHSTRADASDPRCAGGAGLLVSRRPLRSIPGKGQCEPCVRPCSPASRV